jgi:type 1 glutamine amidotransferase
MEEHLPLTLVNDWNVVAEKTEASPASLPHFKVLILPAAAALSDAQVKAIREFVRGGGGLIATGESSLCDELGRPRSDFALADLFGVSYRGRPSAAIAREALDANFAISVDENYWKQRVGAATLKWTDSPIWSDQILNDLVPSRSATFKGPQVLVTEPKPDEVVARMTPAGSTQPPIPAVIARPFGAGRVVYLAACLDAAMWSYSYPYQRRLLTKAIEWTAGEEHQFPIRIEAPKCVQTTFWRQSKSGRTIIHFFNGLNTTANHGLPAVDVPLREESVPIHGIKVHLGKHAFRQAFVEPSHHIPKVVDPAGPVLELPPLQIHQMLILE